MATAWFGIRDITMKRWKERWIERHSSDDTWNAIFFGGKEIRPSLFCELWSHLSPTTQPIGDLAFAIECIHCASLILDDMPTMDNADTRRGKPTIHKLYNTYKASWLVLELLEIVFDIWKENEPTDKDANIIWWNFIKDKVLQLIIGQYYDLTNTSDLYTLAVLKTGTLFEFATELVALKLHLSRDAWRTWGRQLGVLFQWADDWSDLDEDTLSGNRNAFLESPNIIATHYTILYEKSNIGKAWRERPFGNWLMTYFEKNMPIIDTSSNYILLPEVLISSIPHQIFLDTFDPIYVTTKIFERFTLYCKPSITMLRLYDHYKLQIPDLIHRISNTNLTNILSFLISNKYKIQENTTKIWDTLQEEYVEAFIQTEVDNFLSSKGIKSDQLHLLLLCDALLS